MVTNERFARINDLILVLRTTSRESLLEYEDWRGYNPAVKYQMIVNNVAVFRVS